METGTDQLIQSGDKKLAVCQWHMGVESAVASENLCGRCIVNHSMIYSITLSLAWAVYGVGILDVGVCSVAVLTALLSCSILALTACSENSCIVLVNEFFTYLYFYSLTFFIFYLYYLQHGAIGKGYLQSTMRVFLESVVVDVVVSSGLAVTLPSKYSRIVIFLIQVPLLLFLQVFIFILIYLYNRAHGVLGFYCMESCSVMAAGGAIGSTFLLAVLLCCFVRSKHCSVSYIFCIPLAIFHLVMKLLRKVVSSAKQPSNAVVI